MKKAFLILAFLAGCALGATVQYTISERRLPTTASLDTLPRLGDAAAIGTAGGFFGILLTLWFQRKSTESARQVATRDATDVIFRKWWGFDPGYAESIDDKKEGISRDIPGLRTYFYTEFLSWYKEHANTVASAEIRLKDFFKTFDGDKKRLANLTFFFDEVGWLGAAGLIDVDHILGPMQHVLRRVWWVTKPWIEKDRQKEPGYWLDPVRHFGIEWLYQRSVVTPQVDLVQAQFPDLPSLSHVTPNARSANENLRQQLAEDEASFLSILPESLRSQIRNYDGAILTMWKHRGCHGQRHSRLVYECLNVTVTSNAQIEKQGFSTRSDT